MIRVRWKRLGGCAMRNRNEPRRIDETQPIETQVRTARTAFSDTARM